MSLLSVIVPCYNEEENVDCFYEELMKNEPFFVREGLEVEILYIDDGSRDHTVEKVKALRERVLTQKALSEQDSEQGDCPAEEKAGRNISSAGAQGDGGDIASVGTGARSVLPTIRLISFSRNFGKESGIYAGLQKSRGDYVVMMDADLQDPPSLLPEMFSYIKQGYDSVATRRVSRKGEPMIRSFFARRFYRLINRMSKTEIVDGARDYRLMTRQVVDAILSMAEYNRFTKGIFGWVGYETKWIEYENVERAHGETKWSFWKLFVYALDGITAFSTLPLALASVIGILFCFIALVFIVVIIVKTLIFGDPVGGWPSLVCIISLVSGVQLFCLGILGQYLSKTYMEVKHRPIYLIKEEL